MQEFPNTEITNDSNSRNNNNISEKNQNEKNKKKKKRKNNQLHIYASDKRNMRTILNVLIITFLMETFVQFAILTTQAEILGSANSIQRQSDGNLKTHTTCNNNSNINTNSKLDTNGNINFGSLGIYKIRHGRTRQHARHLNELWSLENLNGLTRDDDDGVDNDADDDDKKVRAVAGRDDDNDVDDNDDDDDDDDIYDEDKEQIKNYDRGNVKIKDSINSIIQIKNENAESGDGGGNVYLFFDVVAAPAAAANVVVPKDITNGEESIYLKTTMIGNKTLSFHRVLEIEATSTAESIFSTKNQFVPIDASERIAFRPLTQRMRKLHKRKMMESTRKTEEEEGMRLIKNHRSLAIAEPLQGRSDSRDKGRNRDSSSGSSRRISSVYQNTIKEFDAGLQKDSDRDVLDYQNDVYLRAAKSISGNTLSNLEPSAINAVDDGDNDDVGDSGDNGEDDSADDVGNKVTDAVRQTLRSTTATTPVTTTTTVSMVATPEIEAKRDIETETASVIASEKFRDAEGEMVSTAKVIESFANRNRNYNDNDNNNNNNNNNYSKNNNESRVLRIKGQKLLSNSLKQRQQQQRQQQLLKSRLEFSLMPVASKLIDNQSKENEGRLATKELNRITLDPVHPPAAASPPPRDAAANNDDFLVNKPVLDNYAIDTETYTENSLMETDQTNRNDPLPNLSIQNKNKAKKRHSSERDLNDYDSNADIDVDDPASALFTDAPDASGILQPLSFSPISSDIYGINSDASTDSPTIDDNILQLGEINFDNIEVEAGTEDADVVSEQNPTSEEVDSSYHGEENNPSLDSIAGSDEDIYETNKLLEAVVDAAPNNDNEIYDWDEISRNNRRNLMRGRDVVTKFLQIVETQHSLGSNCEAGTSLNLGEGVVDRYAQDRFRIEAEVAVNRANMLTRIFKMTSPAVQASVNLLHASVLSMVEFDDDIFAAGNCFDWNQHPSQPGLFCPFAYRLPSPNLGAIFAKDLATEYHYLGNTSEWFFQARKNAEKVIAHNEQYLKAFHLYSNKTDERIEELTLAVKYEDGRWSKPYYDCGGGNIWMLTYTVPFFGYENGTYFFKGTSGIDIDLRRVDIDQCPQRNTPGTTQPLNIFAGTDKCKQRTTMCEAIKGLGFRRGSYKCVCRKGYYFPDIFSMQKFFNGSLLEEEYEKLMLGKNSTYNIIAEYECLPCAEGCESCEDGSPCIAALNWPMRTSILVLACAVIGLLPPAAWFTFRYQRVKVVRAASPALLRVIALGAFFIYCTTIVMYPNPNLYTCTARIWLREIGFSLTYGALMLKTWRISVIFRVRSAKAVKITDAALLKRLGIICGVIGTCLLVRTLVSPPDVVVGRTADDLKAFLCKTNWWDYTFTSMEVFFLAWGVRLCIMVRKAPSEFNESRFISMAIYNEFLLTCFLNVSMLFLQSPANPDLLYIIFFCHTQLTVTLLLCLIFGSKFYIVLRSGRSHQEHFGLGHKSSATQFNFKPKVYKYVNTESVTTSSVQTVTAGGTNSAEIKLSDEEALEEIRQLSARLQRIQEMAPPKGIAVVTISSILDGLKASNSLMTVAIAASAHTANTDQFVLQQQEKQQTASLPLLGLNTDLNVYNQQQQQQQQLHQQQRKSGLEIRTKGILNLTATSLPSSASSPTKLIPPTTLTTTTSALLTTKTVTSIAINTTLTGSENFRKEFLKSVPAHFICGHCLQSFKEHYYNNNNNNNNSNSNGNDCHSSTPTLTLCQRLGSPQPEGSISFSNIKLDCMCSQLDGLDRQYSSSEAAVAVGARATVTAVAASAATVGTTASSTQLRRRLHKRTTATNTPPSMCRQHSNMKTENNRSLSRTQRITSCALPLPASDSKIFQVCDNCRNKLGHSQNNNNNNGFGSSSGGNLKKLKSPVDVNCEMTSVREPTMECSSDHWHSSSSNFNSTNQIVTASSSSTNTDNDTCIGTETDDIGHSRRQKICHSDVNRKRNRNRSRNSRCQRRSRKHAELSQNSQSTSALGNNFALACMADFGAPSTSSSTITGGLSIASNVAATIIKEVPPTHTEEELRTNSNLTSSGSKNLGDIIPVQTNGRPKRPDKLMLDLSDRSKYTKEVSV